MKKKFFNILLGGFFVVGLNGCATTYFPLKNQTYFSRPEIKKIVVLPIRVHVNYSYSPVNTIEKAKEKVQLARQYSISALKEELFQRGFDVVDYVPAEAYEQKDYEDKERLKIIDEILEEYYSALFSIKKNLKEEKGKSFDYSVGLRVQDLNRRFSEKPDAYLYLSVDGFVYNLSILEDNAINTVGAIFSLGMTKLFPCVDDILGIDMVIIDAQTGDIMWLDYSTQPGRSLLLKEHIRLVLKPLVEKFAKAYKE